MSAKVDATTPETSTQNAANPRMGPVIAPSSRLLHLPLPLPPNPLIAYRKFTVSDGTSRPALALESARRKLVKEWLPETSMLDVILVRVDLRTEPTLWCFALNSLDNERDVAKELHNLKFEGLIELESGTYAPGDLYPCSQACSEEPKPCSNCPQIWGMRDHSPAACLAPRKPLQSPHAQFLAAVRDRIVDTACSASRNDQRRLTKLQGGFVVGPSRDPGEWAVGWEYESQRRRLTACHLHIHLASAQLVIQLVLRSTSFLPATQPLTPGMPVTLLPYATPAYYLSAFSGAVDNLNTAFRQSLAGHGAGDFEAEGYALCWIATFGGETQRAGATPATDKEQHSEDRGVIAVWPKRLCLISTCRPPLERIPAVAPPLTPPPAPRPIPRPLHEHSPSISLQALKTISVDVAQDVHKFAEFTGSFIDSVVRDRERAKETQRAREQNSPTPGSSTSVAPPPSSLYPFPSSLPHHTLPSGQFYPSPPDFAPGTSHPFTHFQDHSPLQSTYSSHQTPSHSPAVHVYPPHQSSPLAQLPPQSAQIHQVSQSPTFLPPTSTQPIASASSAMDLNPYGFQDSMDWTGMNFDFDNDTGLEPRGGSDTMDGYGDLITDDVFDFFDAPPAIHSLDDALRDIDLDSSVPPNPQDRTFILDDTGWQRIHDMPDPSPHGPDDPSSNSQNATPRSSSAVALPLSPARSVASPIYDMSLIFEPPTPTRSGVIDQSPFEPVRFAYHHGANDGKYYSGKFSLPSPPREGADQSLARPSRPPAERKPVRTLRLKYKTASDPRVATVRRFIGLKRKSDAQPEGDTPHSRKRRSLNPSHAVSKSWDDELVEAILSDTESSDSSSGDETAENVGTDDDDTDADAHDDFEGSDQVSEAYPDSSPFFSPSHPPGPSLLHVQLQPSLLFPFSSTFRMLPNLAHRRVHGSSGTVANTPIPMVSVPTPVSPSVAMGTAADQAKSLETAANVLVREAVENSLWRADKRDQQGLGHPTRRSSSVIQKTRETLWQTEVVHILMKFRGINGFGAPMDFATFLAIPAFPVKEPTPGVRIPPHPPPFELMDPPMISLAQGKNIVQVIPSALRFWEKIGLAPLSGAKDVTVFALFEPAPGQSTAPIGAWLDRVGRTYKARNLGIHRRGSVDAYSDGIVTLRWDNVRKTISGLIPLLPTQGHVVLYVISPPALVEIDSVHFHHLASAIESAINPSGLGALERRALFQFVPYRAVFDTTRFPFTRHFGQEPFVTSVYDRLSWPVDRIIPRQIFARQAHPTRTFVTPPAFTLGRPIAPSFKYVLEWPPAAVDAMDRHTILHIGYRLSPSKEWLFAACIDQRGEGHDLKTWLMRPSDSDKPSNSAEFDSAHRLLNFAMKFARQAKIEWRIVFSKSGRMGIQEAEAWEACLAADVPTFVKDTGTQMHISVVCVEEDSPMIFFPPQGRPSPSNTSTKPSTSYFADASSSTYAFFPQLRGRILPEQELRWYTEQIGDLAEDEPLISPLCTAHMVYAPNGAHFVTVPTGSDAAENAFSCLQVNLMLTWGSECSSLMTWRRSMHELQRDLVHNFNELAVLAREKWRFVNHGALPFHLAAVETMSVALEPLSGEGDSI